VGSFVLKILRSWTLFPPLAVYPNYKTALYSGYYDPEKPQPQGRRTVTLELVFTTPVVLKYGRVSSAIDSSEPVLTVFPSRDHGDKGEVPQRWRRQLTGSSHMKNTRKSFFSIAGSESRMRNRLSKLIVSAY
jgi:hypothetical protein